MLSRLSRGVRSQSWLLVCRATTTRSAAKSTTQCVRMCSTSVLKIEIDAADTTNVEENCDMVNATTKVEDPAIAIVEAIPPYSVRKIVQRLDRFTKLSADHARRHKYGFERSRDAMLRHVEAELGDQAEALLPLLVDVDTLVTMQWPADLEGWHPRDMVRMSPEALSDALEHHPMTAKRDKELKPSKVETRSRVAKDADAGVFDIRWDPVVEEEQLEQGPDECPALQPKVRHVIYVSGLPFDFKEAKVRTAFARCGQIRSVEILNDVRLPPQEEGALDLPSVDQMPIDRQMDILQEILLDGQDEEAPPSGAEGATGNAIDSTANDALMEESSPFLDDESEAPSEVDESSTPALDLGQGPYLARFAAAPPPRPKQALVEFTDAAGEAAALSPTLRALGIAVGGYANKVCYPRDSESQADVGARMGHGVPLGA